MAAVDDLAAVAKPDLREQFLIARRSMSPGAIAAARASVASAVLEHADAAGWTSVAGYRPLRTEPASVELLEALITRGMRVIVPVTQPDNDLSWVRLPGDVPLDVGAIADVDAVLVPALAVAADGTRLGRGGGSYDRALARTPPRCETCALVHDGEIVPWLPAESWDVPVRAYVSPTTGWRAVDPPGGRRNP